VRLRILSDLHREFADADVPDVAADVVVLAGDIDRGTLGLSWATRRFCESDVVYVPGNHEYYSEALPAHAFKLRREAKLLGARLHLLDRASVILAGVRFVGATLWTDFALGGDIRTAIATASQEMNDYRAIRVSPSYRRLRPLDTKSYHLRDRHWLRDAFLESTKGLKTVVVTHHAPSAQSLAGGFASQPIDASYASGLDDLVKSSGAALWIHGHTHRSADYSIGSTRVICNPRGYPGIDEVADFRSDLVIEMR